MAMTSVWETWMIFNNSNVEGLVKTFLGQVGGEEEMMETNVEEVVEQPVEKKGRWNSVLDTSGKAAQITDVENVEEVGEGEDEDVDGMPMEEEDVDGEPMEEDVDGEPMEEEDVDGQPMDEDDLDGMPMEEAPQLPPVVSPDSPPHERIRQEPPPQGAENRAESVKEDEVPRPQKRQRMRAADMFTDD
jgi:U2-associated protein SR140